MGFYGVKDDGFNGMLGVGSVIRCKYRGSKCNTLFLKFIVSFGF